MAPVMKVKVNVAALIGKIKTARADALLQHAEDVATYQTALPEYQDAMVEAMKSALADLLAGGDLPEASRSYSRGKYRNVVTFEVEVPESIEEPSEPRDIDTKQFDSDIALLSMASDETIAISVGDRWSRYL